MKADRQPSTNLTSALCWKTAAIPLFHNGILCVFACVCVYSYASVSWEPSVFGPPKWSLFSSDDSNQRASAICSYTGLPARACMQQCRWIAAKQTPSSNTWTLFLSFTIWENPTERGREEVKDFSTKCFRDLEQPGIFSLVRWPEIDQPRTPGTCHLLMERASEGVREWGRKW